MDNPQKHYAEEVKGKTGMRRVLNAAGYSRDGFAAAWKNEAAFRQLTWLNGALVLFALIMDFSTPVKMVLAAASIVSLIVELFNTGLEAAVDHTSLDKHILAKRAKDVGSAAQFLAMTLIALMWLIALTDRYL